MATGTWKPNLTLLSSGTLTTNTEGHVYAEFELPSPTLAEIQKYNVLFIMIEDQQTSTGHYNGGMYAVSSTVFAGTEDYNRYRYVGTNFNAYISFYLTANNKIGVHIENSTAVAAGNRLIKYVVYGLQ